MQNNYINFKQERDFGSIITDTFKFIRQEYKAVLRLYFKHVGWALLLVIATSTYYQYQSLSQSSDFTIADGPEKFLVELFYQTGLSVLLLVISSLVYSALSFTTINSVIKSYVQNEGEIKDEEVSDFVGRFFSTTLGSIVAFSVLVAFGFALCILPGIYLIVPLTLLFPIIVFQEKTFSEAFSECFKLIKQNWWISFATLVVVGILVSLIGGLFQIPIIVMSTLETLTSIQEGASNPGTQNLATNWLYMLFYILASIAQYILGIITLITITFIYFNLNEYHNKTGTLEDIDRIGS
jgi:hypothetical protein